jgi:predicted nucleic acid-binding protein
MRVVDTSLWIEFLVDSPLADHAQKSIEPLATCVVPAMVYYELVKWSRRNFDPDKSKSLMSLMTNCRFVDMNVAIAELAATLSVQHKLHATDAIIYATAQLHGAPLFTCDAHFKGLPGVEYLEKQISTDLT